MAEVAKVVERHTGPMSDANRVIKMKEGRKLRDAMVAKLSIEERHGLKVITNAIRILDMCKEQIIRGKGCTPDLLRAAATIGVASVDNLYDQ